MRHAALVSGVVLVLLSLAAGCSGKSEEGEASGTGGSGAGGSGGSAAGGSGGSGGSATCGDPDVSCPAEAPYPGAACAMTEACAYPVGDGMNTWNYTCTSGRWNAEATCEGPIGGGCPIPPLAEDCDTPYAGTASGATVEIGPADAAAPFRAFDAGEQVPLIFGGQGSPMVAYRLRIAGADLDCIRIDTTLAINTKGGAPTPNAVALHCGESLGVFSIVPIDDCTNTNEKLDLTLTVDVQGVGSSSVTVQIDNPGCTLYG